MTAWEHARIDIGDERLDRRHESLITTLVASQFEATLGPALLAPNGSPSSSWPRCRATREPPHPTPATAANSGSAPRHRSHVSNLVVDMNGTVVKSGVAWSFPFELRSSKLVRQQTRWAEPTVLSAR